MKCHSSFVVAMTREEDARLHDVTEPDTKVDATRVRFVMRPRTYSFPAVNSRPTRWPAKSFGLSVHFATVYALLLSLIASITYWGATPLGTGTGTGTYTGA